MRIQIALSFAILAVLPAYAENGKPAGNTLLLAAKDLCQGNSEPKDDKVRKFCAALAQHERKQQARLDKSPLREDVALKKAPQGVNPPPPAAQLAAAPAPAQSPEVLGTLILRRDRSSSFEGLDPRITDSQGASVNFTRDELKGSTTGTAQAYGSYTWTMFPENKDLSKPHVSTVGFGPWVYANGSYTVPVNIKNPAISALQTGVQAQAEFGSVIAGTHSFLDLGVAPYYETDFLGKADIKGLMVQLQPLNADWHLNARADTGQPKPVTYVLALNGEANFMNVGDNGYTRFKANTDYAWLGTNAQLRLTFLQAMGPDFLRDRLYANGTAQIYADMYSDIIVRQYIAEVGYKLSQPGSSGQTTVSLTYTYGTDISLLQKMDQVKLAFSFKY